MSLTTAVLLASGGLWLLQSMEDESPKAPTLTPPAVAQSPLPGTQDKAAGELTDAERIARLERAIKAAKDEVKGIEKELEAPKTEYRQAEEKFKELDAKQMQLKKDLEKLVGEGKAEEAAKLEAELKKLQEDWQAARQRFDLAIKERKTQQEKITALKEKITGDEKALQRLTNPTPAPATVATPPAPGAQAPSTGTAAAPAPTAGGSNPNTTQPGVPLAPGMVPPTAPAATAGETNGNGVSAKATGNGTAGNSAAARKANRELKKAQDEVQSKEAEALDAEDKAAAVVARLQTTQKNIELEQKLHNNAQQKADQARQDVSRIEQQIQQAIFNGDRQATGTLRKDLSQAQDRLSAANKDQREISARLGELQSELNGLYAEQIMALKEADSKRLAADDAEKQLARLESPFSWANVRAWLLDRGPKILTILLGMIFLQLLIKVGSGRIVRIMGSRANSYRGEGGSGGENRARTLVGVFRNAASMVILGGGALMVLDTVGIPIVPLMGGAAVVGLAVAFGAQNLIKDYFSGFMVLLEDQYGINDVVKIGDISGLVEKITLRMTVLRGLDGTVHFVPHGTISTVSNMTHGWSRAFFDIGVAYKEDVDKVMRVLTDLGRNLRNDPVFGSLILDDPEMLGVDGFEDSSVLIRFFIKTKPLQQWPVKREMLRRIKRKFDDLNIEIPFPHRTVYHRYEDGGQAELPRRGEAAA